MGGLRDLLPLKPGTEAGLSSDPQDGGIAYQEKARTGLVCEILVYEVGRGRSAVTGFEKVNSWLIGWLAKN
jgi:hypothetical protein